MNYEALAERIFETLKGYGYQITLYDTAGNKTFVPKEAHAFFSNNADIAVFFFENGYDSEIKVFIKGDSTDPTTSHLKLLKNLRETAIKYRVGFNIRKYGKTIEPKLFAFMAPDNQVTETLVAESAGMTGTSRSSYQNVGDCRLIVRHTETINAEVRGSRTRNIQSIFIETAGGERFRYPHQYLQGARAMAQHLSHGGAMNDNIGQRILGINESILELTGLVNYIWTNRNSLTESGVELRAVIREHLAEQKSVLGKLYKPSQYADVVESIKESAFDQTPNQDTVDKLKEILMVEGEEFNNAINKLAIIVTQEEVSLEQNMIDEEDDLVDGDFEMKEELELEQWFESFDPERFLADRKSKYAGEAKAKAAAIKESVELEETKEVEAKAEMINESVAKKSKNIVLSEDKVWDVAISLTETTDSKYIESMYRNIGPANFQKVMEHIKATYKPEVTRKVVEAAKAAVKKSEPLNEDLRLRTSDKRVIKAFLNREEADSKKLYTDGTSIEGLWIGGKDVARWTDDNVLKMGNLDSRSKQTIQRAIRKMAKDDMMDVVFESTIETGNVLNEDGYTGLAGIEVGNKVEITRGEFTGQYATITDVHNSSSIEVKLDNDGFVFDIQPNMVRVQNKVKSKVSEDEYGEVKPRFKPRNQTANRRELYVYVTNYRYVTAVDNDTHERLLKDFDLGDIGGDDYFSHIERALQTVGIHNMVHLVPSHKHRANPDRSDNVDVYDDHTLEHFVATVNMPNEIGEDAEDAGGTPKFVKDVGPDGMDGPDDELVHPFESVMEGADEARTIRLAIKKNLGLTSRDVSVKSRHGGTSSSVSVAIKTPRALEHMSEIENIGKGSESYTRDDVTGEILGGGNTFIFVEIDYAFEQQLRGLIQAEFEKQSGGDLAPGESVTLFGTFKVINQRGEVFVTLGGGRTSDVRDIRYVGSSVLLLIKQLKDDSLYSVIFSG